MPLPTKIKELIPLLDLIPHPEGGFFRETYRSGCEPMSTMGQTGLDCKDPSINLVVANGRAENRPDKDERRNALTSIYWAPTKKSPTLFMTTNYSDHVHYYQGGLPFRYYIYDPATGEFSTHVLGPDLDKGHTLQLPVKGGLWKCGTIEVDKEEIKSSEYDYSLIAEAVAPGFDFHDFGWVTKETIATQLKDADEAVQKTLSAFIQKDASEIQGNKKTVEQTSEFYEDGENKIQRTNERA